MVEVSKIPRRRWRLVFDIVIGRHNLRKSTWRQEVSNLDFRY
jgi:hypothetical protein